MAKYRQIHITFWQDPFIEDLAPMEKYFYLYLMTNSKTTQCGCYEISMKLIKYETGLTQKQINEYIKTLEHEKKIKYNSDNNEFLIVNWLKHNSFRSPKVLKCIKNELEDIKTIIYIDFINSILNSDTSIDSLSIVYDKSMDTSLQQEQEQEQEDNKNNNSRFAPPTLEQVKSYCLERSNNVDPEKFIDFYESKGWVVGKTKMKSWKASVRTWEKSDNKKPNNKVDKFNNYEQRTGVDYEALANKAMQERINNG